MQTVHFTATVNTGLLKPIKTGENEKYASLRGAVKAADKWIADAIATRMEWHRAQLPDRGSPDRPIDATGSESHLDALLDRREVDAGIEYVIRITGSWLAAKVWNHARRDYDDHAVVGTYVVERVVMVYVKTIETTLVDDDEI